MSKYYFMKESWGGGGDLNRSQWLQQEYLSMLKALLFNWWWGHQSRPTTATTLLFLFSWWLSFWPWIWFWVKTRNHYLNQWAKGFSVWTPWFWGLLWSLSFTIGWNYRKICPFYLQYLIRNVYKNSQIWKHIPHIYNAPCHKIKFIYF